MSNYPPPLGPPPPPGSPPPGGPPFQQPGGQPGGFPPSPPPGPGGGPPVQQGGSGNTPLPAVSLGLGIGGLVTFWCCLGWLLGIAAIVTGIIGRNQAAQRGQSPQMANIGL